jgi:HAD superfamily hydrolase (TIGR01509 family)
MKTAPIRCILFDAGNTLMHLDYPFIAHVLADYGHRIEPLAIRIAEYKAKAAIDRELVPEVGDNGSEGLVQPEGAERPSYFATVLHHLGISRAEMDAILEALQAHNQASSLWRVVEPDTRQVLDALAARGFVLAVISNADGRVEADLGRHGLRPCFATVIDSHLVGVEKPNPAIFQLALERLGITSDAAVYVGDVFGIDVMGARRAGLRAVLMDPLARYPGRIDCPRVRRLSELLQLFPDRASS